MSCVGYLKPPFQDEAGATAPYGLLIKGYVSYASSTDAQTEWSSTATKDDIEKVAKKDGFRVTTEIKMVGETMNIIYYLIKDDIIIRVGYVPDMDRPAYIHYREE